jgi:hypothetical protein
MIFKIELKGKWRLPKTNMWYDGILKFEPEDGARLEIYGTFDNNFLENSNQDIIIGKTDGGEITLVENWFKTKKGSEGGIISEYQPLFIFRGQHFESNELINFRKVEFSVFNLFQWLDLTGIKTEFGNNFENFKISYKKLESIKFELNEDCKGSISCKSHFTNGGDNNRIEIEEHSEVTFNYNKKKHYEEILEDIGYFVGFITLFTFEQSYPIRIVFKDEDYTEEGVNGINIKKISCIYQHTFYNNKYKIQRKHQHLIKYGEIKNEFNATIKKWYELYTQMKPIFNNMLMGFRNKNYYSIERFLDNVRALESFHRRNFSNYRLPIEEYDNIVKKILKNDELSEQEKKWLNEKLKYGNEPSLEKRIKELASKYENKYIIDRKINTAKFRRKVVDTRNYFTHYDKSLESKVKEGKEMYLITVKIMGLLYSCILTELGIDKINIEKSLMNILYEE